MVRHSFAEPNTRVKSAVQYANRRARLEQHPLLQPNMPRVILALLKLLDHVKVHGRRLITDADEPGNADGRIDVAPTLNRHIDGDEQITREKWRRDRLDSSRMPAFL